MKKIIPIEFVAAMLLTGCSYVPMEKEPPTIDGYKVVTIDSCEYLKREDVDGNQGFGYFSHKGNCRFCRERRERELQELLKTLQNDNH